MIRYLRALTSAIGIMILLFAVAYALLLTAPRSDEPLVAGDATAPTSTTPAFVPLGSSVPSSDVPIAPALPPQPIDSRCMSYATVVDRVPPTVEAMAHLRLLTVAGTVTAVGPAQWNTVDAAPPNSGDVGPYDVMRVVRIDLGSTLAGQTLSTPLAIWIPGGTIGCSTFIESDAPISIEPGQSFVLFLDNLQPRNGLQGAFHAVQLWPIADNNIVSTPEDGPMTIAALTSRLTPPASTP